MDELTALVTAETFLADTSSSFTIARNDSLLVAGKPKRVVGVVVVFGVVDAVEGIFVLIEKRFPDSCLLFNFLQFLCVYM